MSGKTFWRIEWRVTRRLCVLFLCFGSRVGRPLMLVHVTPPPFRTVGPTHCMKAAEHIFIFSPDRANVTDEWHG